MGIQATKDQLDKLLSTTRRYRIAPYQRKYEWSENQMRHLLEDLVASWRSVPISGADLPNYFLGSFIFQRRGSNTWLIDGQQRLTSLSIILAVMRDMVQEDARLREMLHSYIEMPAYDKSSKAVKRIFHHRGDEEIFDRLVLLQGATKST